MGDPWVPAGALRKLWAPGCANTPVLYRHSKAW